MAQSSKRLSKTTTDHETIRRWVEERGGSPAEVEATARRGETGILRIDFPGFSGEGSLRPIPWDEWFQKFDEAGLALVYEDETAGGERSNFNKLVSRETAAARSQGRRTSSRGGAAGRAGGRTGARREASPAAAARSTGRKTRKTKAPSRRGTRTGSRSRSGGGSASRSRSGARSKSRSRSR
jgi:hypothetical protein